MAVTVIGIGMGTAADVGVDDAADKGGVADAADEVGVDDAAAVVVVAWEEAEEHDS